MAVRDIRLATDFYDRWTGAPLPRVSTPQPPRMYYLLNERLSDVGYNTMNPNPNPQNTLPYIIPEPYPYVSRPTRETCMYMDTNGSTYERTCDVTGQPAQPGSSITPVISFPATVPVTPTTVAPTAVVSTAPTANWPLLIGIGVAAYLLLKG